MNSRKTILISLVLVLIVGICAGQGRRRRPREGEDQSIVYTEGGDRVDSTIVQTAREIASHSTGTPEWTNDAAFSRDVFTFCRIIRDRDPNGSPSAGNWITDFPDSDLNLSYRIQQMTSIRTNPDGRTIRLTSTNLYDYPWIYTVEPGGLLLRQEEVPALRNYLLNGGVLMVDDFWGQWQWEGFRDQIKRVFPEREFVELTMDHPIFHCVFDLKGPLNKLQTPNSRQGIRSQYDGVTWETHLTKDGYYEECTEMHVRAMYDDKGRIMIICTHNCDNGDGWEREGENDFFFHEFSEKRAFPLGINIVFYLMTH